MDLGAEQVHAEDVERLALHVDLPHVHLAVEAEQRGGGGGGDAVLARARLGDDALLAHAHGEERLAEHVVDLVRAGVAEVLALQVDPGAPRVTRQPLGEVQRRRPAGIARQELGEAAAKARVAPGRAEGALELDERAHERLGDEAAPEAAEVAAGVRQSRGIEAGGRHDVARSAAWAAATKRRTLSASFFPGLASTPEATSTA